MNITKAYQVVRQEVTTKHGFIFETKEITRQDVLGHELEIVTSVPIEALWLNGKQWLPQQDTRSTKANKSVHKNATEGAGVIGK